MTKDELLRLTQRYAVPGSTLDLSLSDVTAGYLVLKHESQDNPDNTEHIIGIIWEVPKSEEQSTIGVNSLQYLAGRVAMYRLYLSDEHPEIKFADSLVSFNLYTNAELSHKAEDYATENKISVTYRI